MENLIKTRKSLKRKFQSLKIQKLSEDHNREEAFTPIIKPLNELKNIVQQQQQFSNNLIKPEIKPVADDNNSFKLMRPSSPQLKTPMSKINSSYTGFKTSTPNTIKNSGVPSINDNLNDESSISPLPLFTKSQLDTSYGPYFDDVLNIRKLGNSEFQIDEKNKDILIDEEVYKGTHGLYELIFSKKPENYTENDLRTYQQILDKTNAHKKNYDSLGQIKGNRGFKYTNILRKLFDHDYNTRRKKSSGAGYSKKNFNTFFHKYSTPETHLNYTNQSKQLVYWDDPNELVDRLRLLIASETAGNNNHRNEIISIIEELREANIIQ